MKKIIFQNLLFKTVPYANTIQDIFLLPDSSLIYAGKDFLLKVKIPNLYPTTVSSSSLLPKPRLHLGNAYPNPASGYVTVPYELPEQTASAVLELRELVTGRSIGRYNLAANSRELKVALGAFSYGLYTYSLYINGNLAGTKKLVVIK